MEMNLFIYFLINKKNKLVTIFFLLNEESGLINEIIIFL